MIIILWKYISQIKLSDVLNKDHYSLKGVKRIKIVIPDTKFYQFTFRFFNPRLVSKLYMIIDFKAKLEAFK